MAEKTNGNKRGVLVIYTGGTIGSRPKDPDPDSPQIVVKWDELKKATPELGRLEEKGFGRIDCVSFNEPLDSCNVGPKEWAEMAQIVAKNHEEYEGFVILHGTDTMVYTASALSFMLKNLDKPVILTGAQRSAMVDVRNDATQNFITALELANPRFSGIPVVPEVCIYFGGRLLRGNRSIKRDTSGYEAYESPNLTPLGEVGDRVVVNEKLIRPRPTQPFRSVVRLNTNVNTVIIYPGIQGTEMVRKQLLEIPNLKAAVILSYGSGNIPTDEAFLEIFREANKRGILLANVSQCRRGPVELGIYETSAKLLEAGFVAANDITLEAALCKLMILLGDPDITPEEVGAAYQINEAGEQSVSLYRTAFPVAKDKKVERRGTAESSSYRIPARPLEGVWEADRLERALLRFRNAHFELSGEDAAEETSKKNAAEVRIFVNLDDPAQASETHIGYAGTFKKWPGTGDGIVIFDVTRAIKPIARPGERVSITLYLDTQGASFSWSEVELALLVRELGD